MDERFIIECPKCGLQFEATHETVSFGTIMCPECKYEQDLED